MTAQYIPTPGADTPQATQFTTLDGVRYRLRFDWSARTGLWYLGIYTEAGEALATSLPLVLGTLVISASARRRDSRLPQGALFVHDLRGDAYPVDPGADELRAGGRARLVYLPEADL